VRPAKLSSAGVDEAVVHALAVPIERLARVLRQAMELAFQVAIQTSSAEKDIGFQKFGLVGDSLGRLTAGDRAGKIYLRRAIDRVHVAPGIECFVPSGRFDVGDAVLIALGAEFVSGTPGANRFHWQSVSHDRRWRKLQRGGTSKVLGAFLELRGLQPPAEPGAVGLRYWAAFLLPVM
jgi:hypothetical protein